MSARLHRRNSLSDLEKFRPYLQPQMPDPSHFRRSLDLPKNSRLRSSFEAIAAGPKSAEHRARDHPHPPQLPSLPDARPALPAKLAKQPLQAKYKAKYDRHLVMMLFAFFEEIRGTGTALTPEAVARYRACGLSDDVRTSLLSLLQYGDMKFKRLLTAMFPNATDRDLASMMMLAYPPAPEAPDPDTAAVDMTVRQRQELAEIFRTYDTDGSGCISLSELMDAMRPLGLPREEVQRILAKLDENGDGEISEEEFVNGLFPLYF